MKTSYARLPALVGRVALVAATLGLTACGGGGGGGGGNTSNLPEFPVDAASARTLTGGSPLNPTSEQVGTDLENIVRTANTLLGSDFLVFAGDDAGPERIGGSCGGDTCSYFVLGSGTITVGVSDIGASVSDESGGQLVMLRNGVSLFQTRSFTRDSAFESSSSQNYGGWLDHSLFVVEGLLIEDSSDDSSFVLVGGTSYGESPRTNPPAAEPPPGPGSW